MFSPRLVTWLRRLGRRARGRRGRYRRGVAVGVVGVITPVGVPVAGVKAKAADALAPVACEWATTAVRSQVAENKRRYEDSIEAPVSICGEHGHRAGEFVAPCRPSRLT